MSKNSLLAVGMLAVACLSGCKFVKTDDGDGSAPVDPIAELVETTFTAELVPALTQAAVDIATLRTALSGGLDTAGESHGVRVGGAGGGWNFPVKGSGQVVEENRASRAGTADIDIDGDGKADVVLQLGPVVKGTALRDTTKLYDFSTFRDQIEYAKLGRALNDKAATSIAPAEGGLKGKQVSFVGATVIRSASEVPLIMPVTLEESP